MKNKLIILFLLAILLFGFFIYYNKPVYDIGIESKIPLINNIIDFKFNKLLIESKGKDTLIKDKSNNYTQYKKYIDQNSSLLIKKFNIAKEDINEFLKDIEVKEYLEENKIYKDNEIIITKDIKNNSNKISNFEYYKYDSLKDDFNIIITNINKLYIFTDSSIIELGFLGSDDIYNSLIKEVLNSDLDNLMLYINYTD